MVSNLFILFIILKYIYIYICSHSNQHFVLLAQAPKTIKIYTNRQTLGFDDADSVKETQTIELEPKDFEEDAVINLRFVKFQNISSLVVNNNTFFSHYD